MRPRKNQTWMEATSISQLLTLGAIVRAVLLMYSVFHDHFFRVKYTDIDYMIVVDGASAMAHGGSPFDRTTYRYTPLLAVLVLPAALILNPLGKVVFTLCDLGAARYCYQILRTYATDTSAKWMVSLFILFNPVVLNVSTRGNSDMLITFMSMAVLAKFARGQYYLAAAILGFAVHFKIYPVIYALPLVLGVVENTEGPMFSSRVVRAMPVVAMCGALFLVGFGLPTAACYAWYGKQYLQEAFLYHVHREDHRHNFSPYWLLMYLNTGRRELSIGVDYSAGLFAFIPQFVVLFYASWKLRRNIAHACCVETVLFVAFNKVCTVQYFVWFLPFLAFVFCESQSEARAVQAIHRSESRLALSRNDSLRYGRPSLLTTVAVITAWSSTIPLWVVTAYPLEFEGKNHFGRLWLVSCAFFLATVCLAAWLGRVCRRAEMQAEKDQNILGRKER